MTHLTISNHNITPFMGHDRKQGEGGIGHLHNCEAMIKKIIKSLHSPPGTTYTGSRRRSPSPIFPKRFMIGQNRVIIE